ncbi:MAG: outer membrane beta-barrel family protein [bacterium]
MIKYFSAFVAICLLFPLLISNNAAAHPPVVNSTGNITGTVVDASNNQPIPYVTVTLMNQKDSSIVTGAISKSDGSFLVENIPLGNFIVRLSIIGFDNYYLPEVILNNNQLQNDIGTIKLDPKSLLSKEIIVDAEKDAVTYQIDKKVVNVSQILEAQSGTASDVLKTVPSVNVDIEGNVTLRGSGNFTLLIDGKPTVISANDLLKQLPASTIETIEIITNPSAKYDPEGSSGVINIIMKKQASGNNVMNGFNGIINSSIGTRDKYSADGLFNYRTDKYNLFIGLDGNSRQYHPKSDFMRNTYSGDTTFYVNTVMDRLMIPSGWSLKSGLDYFVNDLNTIAISFNYGYYGFGRYFPSEFRAWTSADNTNLYQSNNDDFDIDGYYFSSNINYQKKFEEKGHEINTNLFLAGWNGGIDQYSKLFDTDEYFLNKSLVDMHKAMFNNDKINIRAKVDYVLPFSAKSKFEAGYQGDILQTKNLYKYLDFDKANQVWENNMNYSNDYNFTQNTQAVYSSFSDELLNIQYQLGARMEYYERVLKQVSQEKSYNLNQFNLFPSVHLTRQFDGDHQLQLSYSKRVQRPQDRSLNPFPDYVDEYYISTGNPYLKPEFTDSYEFNYRKGFGMSFISLETYYRRTTDEFTRTISLQDDGRMLLSLGNVNTSSNLGTELAINFMSAKWFRFYGSLNYFNYRYTEKINFKDTERNQNVIDANAMFTYIPFPSTFIQLRTQYQGPRIIPNNGDMKEILVFGLAIRQDFFERKLTLTLSGRDIFSTAKYHFTNSSYNFLSYGYMFPEQPAFDISISYKINNYKPDRRKTEMPDVNFDSNI